MNPSLLLILATDLLAVAAPGDPTLETLATCHLNDPRAGSDHPRTKGWCKSTKRMCGLAGGEAYRYVLIGA